MADPRRDSVSLMTLPVRLELVVRQAATILPGDVGHRLIGLLSPISLVVMAGVVAIWAASHFVGVGEVADVVLLVAGWITIGSGAMVAIRKLISFAITISTAQSNADLDKAAQELADAVTILGVDVALGLLFRGRPKTTFREPYRPEVSFPSYRQFASVMPKGGPTRMYEARLVFTRNRPAGEAGTRFVDNAAIVSRKYYPEAKSSADAFLNVQKAVYHERVHQRLTQAFSVLGRPAVYMKMGAYKRSFILRYLEEAAAEAYALSRVGGPKPGELSAIEFPLNGRYGVTVAAIGMEVRGILLGPVTIAGIAMNATFGVLYDNHQS